MKLQRMAAVAHKEWREVVRDRLFFTMAFGLPLLLILVLGYGLSLDVENIPFAVLDHDRSELSRDYVHRFADSRYFEFRGYAEREAELDRLLARSEIRLALIIPPDFGRRLRADRPAAVQALIDGVFPYRAQTTKGYLVAINAAANSELLTDYLARRRGLSREQALAEITPVRLQPRYLYNQAMKSDWSMAAGLLMLVLMVSPPFLTALGVVREKENGSIYNIYASTVSRGEFILGKLLPYVGISCFNILLLWLVAMQVFGAPFKGDPLFFFLASVVYVGCTAGIGLLVSILVQTQVAAVLLTMVITFIPAMLYSGLLVPVSSMGAEAQIEARLLPPLYYMNITWGSFLKGLGLASLWPNVLVLAIYAAVLWSIGFLSFHKRPKR
ncbi:ABC transporter permease [Thiohalobacter sp. IOR34]|uniref:ABC transporter permease n=1 Tax=Thiohalobacter sp. IOR34 TaxID=3057176 RepID=UPI0025B070AE|nr:ABC transporter permease [Thiohalobacter sp. IOR34]WJW76344.1 ABC transporter permease [Thiohalobacter sp. IOR34]